jgi:hypothetical protein
MVSAGLQIARSRSALANLGQELELPTTSNCHLNKVCSAQGVIASSVS